MSKLALRLLEKAIVSPNHAGSVSMRADAPVATCAATEPAPRSASATPQAAVTLAPSSRLVSAAASLSPRLRIGDRPNLGGFRNLVNLARRFLLSENVLPEARSSWRTSDRSA